MEKNNIQPPRPTQPSNIVTFGEPIEGDSISMSLPVALILASVAIGTALMIIVPTINNARENYRQTKIETCMQMAYDSYNETWQSSCKAQNEPDDCQLSTITANTYNESLKSDKQNCIQRYQAK